MSIEMYGWEPTFELLVKPILKHICMRWHQSEIEGWSLLSSKCAVVFDRPLYTQPYYIDFSKLFFSHCSYSCHCILGAEK